MAEQTSDDAASGATTGASADETTGEYTYFLCSDGWGKPPFALARLKASPPDVDRWTPDGWVPADNLHENISNFGNDARSEEVSAEDAQKWIEKKKGGTPAPQIPKPSDQNAQQGKPGQPQAQPQDQSKEQTKVGPKASQQPAGNPAVEALRQKVKPKK